MTLISGGESPKNTNKHGSVENGNPLGYRSLGHSSSNAQLSKIHGMLMGSLLVVNGVYITLRNGLMNGSLRLEPLFLESNML